MTNSCEFCGAPVCEHVIASLMAKQPKTPQPGLSTDTLEDLFYDAITEDRSAEENADSQTIGQRCRKYAAKANALLGAAPPATEAIRELVAKWRKGAGDSRCDMLFREALEQCADELEAAIQASAPARAGGIIVNRKFRPLTGTCEPAGADARREAERKVVEAAVLWASDRDSISWSEARKRGQLLIEAVENLASWPAIGASVEGELNKIDDRNAQVDSMQSMSVDARREALEEAACDIRNTHKMLDDAGIECGPGSKEPRSLLYRVALVLEKLDVRALASWPAAARCIGYPDCDGNLPGEPHEEKCPLFKPPATPGGRP